MVRPLEVVNLQLDYVIPIRKQCPQMKRVYHIITDHSLLGT